MNSIEILFSYPAWYLLLCAAFAGLAAWLLYQKPLFGEEDKRWIRRALGAIRFLFLFLLAMLLMEPLVKNQVRELEKPVLALVIDNSASMRMQADSAGLAEQIQECISTLETTLGDDHEIRVYGAGHGLNETRDLAYTEQVSDLSKSLKTIDDQFENQNLGAIVLFSDGIYNQGSNPVYQTRKSTAPVYTVPFGDTTEHRDLVLEEVRHNRLSYLGNQFPLLAVCRANDLQGKSAKLRVMQDKKLLFEKTLLIDDQHWSQQVEILLKAETSGMVKYTVSLDIIAGEHNLLNNKKTLYIEVIDARNQVMLLAHAPHPDLGAMAAAIRSNENYEVTVKYASSTGEFNWQEINLLILHQLPSRNYPILPLLEQAEKFNVPVLFVVGESTNLTQLKSWSAGLGIQSTVSTANASQGVYNPQFELFKPSDESINALKRFPPLYSPFGSYTTVSKNKVFLYQKIGSIESNDPLVAFSENGEQKIGMIYGEGYWRWRLYDYEQHQNHEASNEIMQKLVQFLSAKRDNRPFKADPLKRRFDENERLLFRAELYNASFQLVNDPDVFMRIKGEDGKEFSYQFGRDQSAYTLDAGFLAPGDYRYTATVNYGGKQLTSIGLFSVSPLELEAINTRADFLLLSQLAEKNGGKRYAPSAMRALAETIKANEKIHTVSYMRSSLEDLIRLPWLFWVLLTFISFEWFVRKYKGAY